MPYVSTPRSTLRCLIAAAGRGARSGLLTPKTLAHVGGVPILVRMLLSLKSLDSWPFVIVSPQGHAMIAAELAARNLQAELLVQPEPGGMGDAVLHSEAAVTAAGCDTVLLLWGDVPLVQRSTLTSLVALHHADNNVLSFATRYVDASYTSVERDGAGRVVHVAESRECRDLGRWVGAGERDAGIFAFDPGVVFPCLREKGDGWIGAVTGEHGFLYVISHLVRRGCSVEGYPIATPLDVLGFNTPADLQGIEIALRDTR